MGLKHCELCERNVQTRRKIGVGTLILTLITIGGWIFAIPFYQQKCPICWGSHFGRLGAGPVRDRMDDRKARERGLLIAVAVVAVVAYVISRYQS